MGKENVLMVSDQCGIPLGEVNNGIRMVTKKEIEQCGNLTLSIFSSASLASSQWKESSSTDYVVCLCKSLEFPEDELLANLSRVLKPGGTIFLQFISESAQGETIRSSLERKLMLAGFVDLQFSGGESLEILGKKPSLDD